MNSVKAVTKLVRISPRKARLAAGLIRGLSYVQAKNQLAHSNLKAGRLLMKTLDSAAANAAHNLSIGQEFLSVLEVRIDAGPTMKRSKSKNKGGQHPVMKRTSHFSVIVGTK